MNGNLVFIPDFATQLILKSQMESGTCKFYSNIFRVLTGVRRTQAAAGVYHDFWHSVSFYNFVQQAVGPSPRYRPTETMWKDGLPYFETVFTELSPHAVLVLGKQLWWNLTELAVVHEAANGNHFVSIGSSTALATYICHPSSSRYSYAASRPSVEKLLLMREDVIRHLMAYGSHYRNRTCFPNRKSDFLTGFSQQS